MTGGALYGAVSLGINEGLIGVGFGLLIGAAFGVPIGVINGFVVGIIGAATVTPTASETKLTTRARIGGIVAVSVFGLAMAADGAIAAAVPAVVGGALGWHAAPRVISAAVEPIRESMTFEKARTS